MRIGEGTITEILDGGLAKVRVNRDHLYVACSACFGAEHVYVTARNGLGAQEGQDVRYEVQDEHLVMGAFICFIVPLFLVILGGIGGYSFGATVLSALIGAAAGLIVSAVLVKLYDSSLGKKIDTKATITEIIETEDDES